MQQWSGKEGTNKRIVAAVYLLIVFGMDSGIHFNVWPWGNEREVEAKVPGYGVDDGWDRALQRYAEDLALGIPFILAVGGHGVFSGIWRR